MAEPVASLVVVAYGQRPLVARLLESIAAHTPEVHEVVLVDNASPDDTAEWVHEHHPEVQLVDAGTNLGYGGGANLGVRVARADHIVLLNSDLEVMPGWLGPLLRALQQPGVAIAAPISVDQAGRVVEAGATVTADGHVHVIDELPDGPVAAEPITVPHASASCWAFDRSWFTRVGGFDPSYGLGYYEDLDLSIVAEVRGLHVVVEPESLVRHDVGGSFGGELQQRLSHRNHRRALTRWEWIRHGAVADPVPHEHRLHGRVLFVGFDAGDVDAVTRGLQRRHIGVRVVSGTPDEMRSAIVERHHLDDVLVVASSGGTGKLVADVSDVAPRSVVCTLEDLEEALGVAGVAGSTVSRQPRHGLLNSVRGRSW